MIGLTLLACERPVKPAFQGSDITGADFGRHLALNDHNGRRVDLNTFRGKLVVLFFGYTHCPDVCPTTLSDMAAAFELLPNGMPDKIQVLFVTVDPERDTPEVLRAYVPYFHPTFLGLHGDAEAVARAAREFRVVYRRHGGDGGYLIDHSAGSYVLDAQGRLRLYLPFGQAPETIAQDLSTLFKGDSE